MRPKRDIRNVSEIERNSADSSEQLIQMARQYASEIIRGVVTPYEGGHRIWMECQVKLASDDHRLDPFVYWASEYEETSGKDRLELCEHALRVAVDSLVSRGTAL